MMLRASTTRLSVALAALAFGSGALQAANKLVLSPTSTTVYCNPHITGQIGIPINVKPVTALTGTNTLAVTLPSSFTGGVIVTPPATTTLSTTNQSAGITYTISLPNGCAGVTSGSVVTVGFLAAGATDASVAATTTITSTNSLSVALSPSSFSCSLQNGPTPVTATVTSVATLTSAQTIAVTLPGTIPGGLTVTPPSSTTLSSTNTSLAYTISSAAACTNVVNGASPSFNLIAGGVNDVAVTVPTAVTSTTVLSINPSSITPTCSTATGPSPTTITVKPAVPLTGNNTITVALPASFSNGVTVTPPASTVLNTTNQGTGLQYVVSQAAGCVGVTSGSSSGSFAFKIGSTNDAQLSITPTLANTVSGLQVSNANVTVNCTTAAPGVAQNVAVTSTALGGTPFTVVTTGLPTGVTVTPTTGGTAGTSAMNYSIQAASGCGGVAVGSTSSGSLVLHNAPGPDKTINIVMQVTQGSPLSATPSTVSMSYVKGTGSAATAAVRLTSTTVPSAFFSVDTTSLPIWLTVDSFSGTVPKTINFSSTTIADSLAPGTYSGTVRVKVSTYGDLSLPFSLLITNSAPKLSVSPGTSVNTNWTMGQAVPTSYITLYSSDSPIPFSVTTGGNLAPSVPSTQSSGLAYSFGTQIPVTFSNTVFASAQPADVLTGTMTITWGSANATTVITFNITVLSASATLTSISPASLPTAASGQTYSMVLTGTGFVPSTNTSQKTTVGIVSNGVLFQDTNIASTVVNTSNILLTITVPATADPYLPFANGGTVTLGVCNPQGSTCSTPTATLPFSIGNGPVIQVVTSASSFQQVTGTTKQKIAAYDMVSIFGNNFCSGTVPSTACASTQLIPGVLNTSTMVYQNWVAIDAAGATQRQLSVSFCPTGTTSNCVNAPILYATNSQINAVVPGSLSTGDIDMIVNYGYGAMGTSTLSSSAPMTVTVMAADPGIFAIGADGQGPGAILDSNWALVNSSNPAAMRSVGADSSSVQIYMTGLGAPDSTAVNSGTAGTGTYPTDCIDPAEYLSTLNTSASSQLSTVDGAIIQSSLLVSGKLPPCISTAPTVTIGGQSVTASYAAWVADSIAGLYQVNFRLPATTPTSGTYVDVSNVTHSSITAPVQLPITVTVGGKTSQTGVSIWVAPRLKVTGPSGSGLSGSVGVAWASSNNSVTATEGTSPYRYAVTSGVLPTGLALNASTGAISGTPAAGRAGTYVLTVTATDSANVPLTGTVTFTLTVGGGLIMSASPSTYTGTVVTSSTPVTTVAATGGTYPYTYSFDSSFTVPNGMSIGSTSGIIAINGLTPAGTYNVVVDAVDTSNGWTGTITLPVTLKLNVTSAAGTGGWTGTAPTFNGTAGTAYTINLTATGGTTYSYAFHTAPSDSGITISSNIVSVGTGTAAGTYDVQIDVTSGSATGTITLHIVLAPGS